MYLCVYAVDMATPTEGGGGMLGRVVGGVEGGAGQVPLPCSSERWGAGLEARWGSGGCSGYTGVRGHLHRKEGEHVYVL